ncbi:MAG: glycosyltransferase family 4 protein [Kiloniellaceae bacterium]
MSAAADFVQDAGKRVLHVSSAHRVSDGRIARKEAAALAEAGYDVVVLGLKRVEGTVLPSGPRFVEYADPAPRARRFLLRLPWLIGYCLKHRFDIYHLHDPDLIPLGAVLKLLGRRVVYDVHEAYSKVILDRDWIPRVLRPVLARTWLSVEAAFVRWTDLTIAAHDVVNQQFTGGSVVTVCNYPIMDDIAAAARTPMAQRPCRVIYHGDLTRQRGLVTMIEAIDKVEWDTEPALTLGGSLTPTLETEISQMPGMRRTDYVGWLNTDRLAEELGRARAGLVMLHPTHNYKVIRPNKLFEYMAAGLPVVASDFSHWREVVVPVNCGLLVDPLDSTAIARAIEYLLGHPEEAAAMGQRGRQAVVDHYNWAAERDQLIAGYDSIFGNLAAGAQRLST